MSADAPAASRGDLRRAMTLLRRFARGERRWFVFALVMLGIEAATAVFEAWPIAYLIDFLPGDRPPLQTPLPASLAPRTETVLVLTGLIVVIAMFNSLADSLAEIFLARGGRVLGANMRSGLFAHLQRLSLAFHHQKRTGDVLTRVTGDVGVVEDFIVDSFSDLFGSVLLLAGTLIFLFTQSWQVALIALIIVPIVSVVANHYAKRIKSAAKRVRALEGDLASSAEEMLSSIRVIQTYGRGSLSERRFTEQARTTLRAALETAGLEARFSWAVKVMEAVVLAGVVWAGLWLVDRAALTVGTLVLFVILIQNMFKPTRRIVNEWNTFGKVFASVERIADLLDRRPSVEDLPGAVSVHRVKGAVEFRNVSFAYQTEDAGTGRTLRLALDDVSFAIQPGEAVALVGHSGAGKSTIAQLLPRLYDPHAGQVLLDGADVRGLTLDSLRAQVGVVLQESILFTGTIGENIAYGREDATPEQVRYAARQANAEEFILQLPEGYDAVLGERGANLSGGQRQRIAIARAFVRDAPILVLDEPTTGLDAASTDLVLSALRALVTGKTTLIISHDLNLIRFSDRILVLEAGRLEQVGTHTELLRAGGLYAELYAKQFGEDAAAREIATPPVRDEVDGESRDEFQTMLTEVIPVPATLDVFQALTAGRPAATEPEGRFHTDVLPTIPPPPLPGDGRLAPPPLPKETER